MLGRIYGVAVLIGSLGGFYLALTIPGHTPYSAGLFMLDVAWVLTTGMALYAFEHAALSSIANGCCAATR
jgi:hypothetical protein